MSFFQTIQRASSSAQSTLAQLQGMAAGAAGNVLYEGRNYVGVFATPVVVEVPVPGGGYRRRAEMALSITRDQMPNPPVTKRLITRTDLRPNVTYIIDTLIVHDPVRWVMTVVKQGE